MIHAILDGPTTKNIIGFECGTRADFDVRHVADPLWVFLDSNIINYHVDKAAFLLNPKNYYIDNKGNIQRRP